MPIGEAPIGTHPRPAGSVPPEGEVDGSSRRHPQGQFQAGSNPARRAAPVHPHSPQAIRGPVGQGSDGPVSVAGFIASQRTEHSVPHAVACQALGVSESWFYKWRDRPPTRRDDQRARLTAAVRKVFDDSGGTYGSPRIGIELREQGWQVSDNTIAQLMAGSGLTARVRRRRRSLTSQGTRPTAPDLVKRAFTAPAPNRVWCGDMTEIRTDEGKLYLATVIDLYSCRILGYAIGAHHDAGLVVAALSMAAVTRGGNVEGVIFHSDRGSEGGFNRSSQHQVGNQAKEVSCQGFVVQ